MLLRFVHDRFVVCISRSIAFAVLLAVAPLTFAQDDAAETSEEIKIDISKISYFFGVSFGQQLTGNGLEVEDLDVDRLIAGLKDGLAGDEPKLSEEDLTNTQQQIQMLLVRRMQQMKEEAKKDGEEYLAKIAKEPGVKELSGGLLYKVIEPGKGKSPSATDTVKVHYTGRLVNGNVFDSSVQRGTPSTFRVNQVIKGWKMALQEMKEGDKWMIYIPSDLAYGAQGNQRIAPNSALTFEVELIEVQ